MQTITEVLEQIERAPANAEVRLIESIEVGQVVRQGDIYIHRVDDAHPRGKVTQNRQLAIGTTQGSRHVAESGSVFAGTTAPSWAPAALLGPCVESTERIQISHPEHAHIDLPRGTYQITHQMDARTLERVAD